MAKLSFNTWRIIYNEMLTRLPLQSKMPLFGEGFDRATDLPTLICWSAPVNRRVRFWNGCELGRAKNSARGTPWTPESKGWSPGDPGTEESLGGVITIPLCLTWPTCGRSFQPVNINLQITLGHCFSTFFKWRDLTNRKWLLDYCT